MAVRRSNKQQLVKWVRSAFGSAHAQAEEVRTLSTQVAADAAKPMKRGLEELKKTR
jgi:hypothetical protein